MSLCNAHNLNHEQQFHYNYFIVLGATTVFVNNLTFVCCARVCPALQPVHNEKRRNNLMSCLSFRLFIAADEGAAQEEEMVCFSSSSAAAVTVPHHV